jgi:hypothetical protein
MPSILPGLARQRGDRNGALHDLEEHRGPTAQERGKR